MKPKQVIEGSKVKFNDYGVTIYGTLNGEIAQQADGTKVARVIGVTGHILCGDGVNTWLPIEGLKKDTRKQKHSETHKRVKRIVKGMLKGEK